MVLGYTSDLMDGVRSPVALLAVVVATCISWSITTMIQDMAYAVLLLMFFGLGFFINSLNNIISSVCAADLGKQSTIQGNEKAISTITGIIDGTGSAGSAIGQLIVGYTLPHLSWRKGYLGVISVDISICIVPVAIILMKEISEYRGLKSAASEMMAESGSKS
jgi:sugar phosphate permease